VERVVNRIRDLLLTRALRPGDRLPSEGELAEMLAVGRGSVREAMKILSGCGAPWLSPSSLGTNQAR